MRAARRAAAAAASAWLLAAGCSAAGRRDRPPPDPDLRIWAPPVLHWAAGADREVRFAIENGTHRTVRVPEPHPRFARLEVFPDAEGPRACGVEAAGGGGERAVELAPGEQAPVVLDLSSACRAIAPGEYRYELSYRVPGEHGGGGTVLQTRYGILVVAPAGPGGAGAAGGGAGRARPAGR
jgi:hypothetical protein